MQRIDFVVKVTSVALVITVAAALGIRQRNKYIQQAKWDEIRALSEKKFDLVYVDRHEFSRWQSLIRSKEWETIRLDEAYSSTFSAIEEAGFEPSADGYLSLLTQDLPPPSDLSAEELEKLATAARWRSLSSFLDAGDVQVYTEDGVILGFSEPTHDPSNSYRLALLENGVYIGYLSERRVKNAGPQKGDMLLKPQE